MPKSRLQHRNEKIEELTNLKNSEWEDNKRLKRKKEHLEQSVCNHFIINGTIEEMEFELKHIKKEREDKQKKIEKLTRQISNNIRNILNYKCTICRLKQMIYMEDDIKFYYWYSKQYNIIYSKKTELSKIKIQDSLLLSVLGLPNEMMNIIFEYMTWETKCSILENKFDPIKLIGKFQPNHIKEILNNIYQNKLLISLDNEMNNHIVTKFAMFYDCSYTTELRLRLKRNITDERIFLKNIILSFKPKNSEIMYSLFKLIIIVYKNLFKKN
jgi:hypothetical protein